MVVKSDTRAIYEELQCLSFNSQVGCMYVDYVFAVQSIILKK